jgi:hypothetical protein
LKKKTKERGYNPEVSKIILLSYIEDVPRSGKPFLGANLTKLVLSIITQNSTNRS